MLTFPPYPYERSRTALLRSCYRLYTPNPYQVEVFGDCGDLAHAVLHIIVHETEYSYVVQQEVGLRPDQPRPCHEYRVVTSVQVPQRP